MNRLYYKDMLIIVNRERLGGWSAKFANYKIMAVSETKKKAIELLICSWKYKTVNFEKENGGRGDE